VHRQSPRANGPFVAVNCGAIPETLLESELFGHKKGAFTDASADKRGLFEEATGGTLFLDEVGELPMPLQVKLLRVLQEETIRKLGDVRDTKIDVRIVAATMRDLGKEVGLGQFREDLFYRLNVLPIHIPPLRERREDIPPLLDHFVEQTNKRLGTSVQGIDADAMKMLLEYGWPGNVREVENTIERAMVLAEGKTIRVVDLPEKLSEASDPVKMTLASGELSVKKTTRIIEEILIRRALHRTGGNRTRAAELLELSHRALLYKIKDYGIS
jgi:two-component system, NtrC family, response regulator AtoC